MNQVPVCLFTLALRGWLRFVAGTAITRLRPKKVYTLHLYDVIRISASSLFFVQESDFQEGIFRS